MRANGLLVDESMLTGESVPVLKCRGCDSRSAAEHCVRAGTLVVQGDGVGIVCATGARTALGRSAARWRSIAPRPSRLQARAQAGRAPRRRLRGAGQRRGGRCCTRHGRARWLDGLLAGLTLAMAIIPEEFAVVWTVMLALGAWRLARLRVLTRQAQAIEALGTTTVLAVDKTGTLTHNRMELVALATPPKPRQLGAGRRRRRSASHALLHGGRAGQRGRRHRADGPRAAALARALVRRVARSAARCLQRARRAPERPYFSNWWRTADGSGGVHAVKGAPEAVLRAVRDRRRLARAQSRADAERLAQQGLRVLGVAQARLARRVPRRGTTRRLTLDRPARLPRPGARRRAGGDRAVPRSRHARGHDHRRCAGHRGGDRAHGRARPRAAPTVVTGHAARGDDDARTRRALSAATAIYARVSPAQKLRIVRALQRRGEVVAMTGDGVNDASALRAADIGVAMGRRGTDVAREAAALVLLDDSFAALVDAVRMGRRIFGNLRNAVGYLIAVHVPIVGVSLLPVLLGRAGAAAAAARGAARADHRPGLLAGVRGRSRSRADCMRAAAAPRRRAAAVARSASCARSASARWRCWRSRPLIAAGSRRSTWSAGGCASGRARRADRSATC